MVLKENCRSITTLSKYIWDLKEEVANYVQLRNEKNGLLLSVLTHKSGDAQCNLYLQEKIYSLDSENGALLNKRYDGPYELWAKCRHRKNSRR